MKLNLPIGAFLLALCSIFSVPALAQIPSFSYTYGHGNNNVLYNNSAFFITEYYGDANNAPGYLQVSNLDNTTGGLMGFKLTASDQTGMVLWSTRIPLREGRVFSITYDDRDNSYILTGYVLNTSTNRHELLLMKVNSAGTPVWTQSFGTNIANCNNCVTDIQLPYMYGVSLMKVKNDPTPGSDDHFVITGFACKGDGALNLNTARRGFIWRADIPLGGAPAISTVFFKFFHGGFYTGGSYEPTNFDVPTNVQEINGVGFMVMGSTKLVGNSFGTPMSTVSNDFRPFYGLIPYNGGTGFTGPQTFIYAFLDSAADSRNVVRIFPDYNTGIGYLLLNNNDRGWFEVLPISLASGARLALPRNYRVLWPDPFQVLVGSNIVDLDAGRMTVMGYAIDEHNTNYVYPFTIAVNKNNLTSGPFKFITASSAQYIDYNPLAAPYDFFKTSTTMYYSSANLRSVITPVMGIINSHVGFDDAVTVSPHYSTMTYPGVYAINAKMSLFTYRDDISCGPLEYQSQVIQYTNRWGDYRLISNVDGTNLISTEYNVGEDRGYGILDCGVQPKAAMETGLQGMGSPIGEPLEYESGAQTVTLAPGLKTATMFDISGRKVLDIQDGATNISHLPAGIYLIRVTDASGKTSVRKINKL